MLVVIAVIAIVLVLFVSANPGRAARRLEIANGHKQIEEMRLAGTSWRDRWDYTLDHCEKLVRACREHPDFRTFSNPDGTREDKDVLRMEELFELRKAAIAATPPQSTSLFDHEIEALRQVLELRYFKLVRRIE
jgi:hypothetical protein